MPMIFWHTWLSVNEELGCVWMTMNPAERRTVARGGDSMHINKNGVQDEPAASREAAASLLLNLHWRGSNWAVTGWVQCATIIITLCANMAGFQGESRKTYVLSEVFWNQIHLFMFWKKKIHGYWFGDYTTKIYQFIYVPDRQSTKSNNWKAKNTLPNIDNFFPGILRAIFSLLM